MTYRTILMLSLSFACATHAATIRTGDPVLQSAWERSIQALTNPEIALAEPGDDVPYLSTVALEQALGIAYATGSSERLLAVVLATRPTGAAPADMRPDWPMLLEYAAQWDPDSPEIQECIVRDLEVWLDHFLGKFSEIGLVRPSPTLRLPLEWNAHLPNTRPTLTQRFLDSALLYRALMAAARVRGEAGLPADRYRAAGETLREAFHKFRWNKDAKLFSTMGKEPSFSPWLNAVALNAGLWPNEDASALADLLKKEGANCPEEFVPAVIEAAATVGDPQLAYDLLSFVTDFQRQPALRIIVEGFGGLRAARGFRQVSIAPHTPLRVESFRWTVHVPDGRLSLEWDRGRGYDLTVSPQVSVLIHPEQGAPITMQHRLSHATGALTPEQAAFLETAGWTERTNGERAVWVSIDDQMFRLIENGAVIFQARCATAEKGAGFQMNSLQTPLGWHTVAKKIGDKAPWGQVFRSRQATREVWQPGEDVTEDLVLTRLLWLTGSEPGKNKGGKVDSYDRSIYIHGTNDEIRIGSPSSHGCVRLTNDDVIEAFSLIPKNTPVLITDGESF